MNPSWAFKLDHVNDWAYWSNAFSLDECNQIIAAGKNLGVKEATFFDSPNLTAKNEKVRKSNVAWITPTEEFGWVYRRLTDIVVTLNNQYFEFDLFGFTEGLQFTEYQNNGGHYSKHIDKLRNDVVRKMSVVVQLTDPNEYEGGELLLHLSSKPVKVMKDRGTVIVFPSYVLHEVKPVTAGTRHSLVAWVTGKPFV